MDIAIVAFSLTGLWTQWVWPILMFIIGLDLVIFVHELGHFLLAKAVGIRVDRFSVGIGPRLFGIRKGQTDYCICALPIGGYVAMLGQEDFKPDTQVQDDPRAFRNKSVGARFLVISAGVVMNVIFSAILFVTVCLIGIEFRAPVVGGVLPGFPAANARIVWNVAPATQPASQAASQATTATATQPVVTTGIQPGDRVRRIDGENFILNMVGRRVSHFNDLLMTAILAGPDDQFVFTVERRVAGQTWIGTAALGVKRLRGDGRLDFGIDYASDTVFAEPEDLAVDTPFRQGDRLLAVDGRKIKHSWEVGEIEKSLTGGAVLVTVLRGAEQSQIPWRPALFLGGKGLWLRDGSRVAGQLDSQDLEKGTVTIALADGTKRTWKQEELPGGSVHELLDIAGLIPRIKVLAVRRGSRADDARLEPGDIIVGYADRGAPTFRELREINEQAKDDGTNMVLLRRGQPRKVWIVPKSRRYRAEIGIAPGVDLTHTVVAGVREGSPAAKAGIVPGAQITAVNDVPVETWIDVCNQIKARMGEEVTLTYQIGAQPDTVSIGRLTKELFDPEDYSLMLFAGDVFLEPLTVTITEKNPLKAIAWGCRETSKFVLTTYLSLRSLMRGTVSTETISGPVGIGGLAIKVGRKSVIEFVYFMAFISAAIAVFNFLPIPVMDGGHAVFLLIEKIRGKPVPPKVLVTAQIAGLVLIGVLFIALTWNDITNLLRRMW